MCVCVCPCYFILTLPGMWKHKSCCRTDWKNISLRHGVWHHHALRIRRENEAWWLWQCSGYYATSHMTVLFVKYVSGDSLEDPPEWNSLAADRRGGRGVAAVCIRPVLRLSCMCWSEHDPTNRCRDCSHVVSATLTFRLHLLHKLSII